MFRRHSNDETPQPADLAVKDSGKGKPTPTRKEAEAARLARVRPAQDRRTQARRRREQMASERSKTRQAMARGDESGFMVRDRGPVRKFVRDFVDSRRTIAEFFMPLLLVVLVLSFFASSNVKIAWVSSLVWVLTMVLVAVDLTVIGLRLRKESRRRFPDDPRKGAVFYGLMRSTQPRKLRMPKPTVKAGAHV